MSKKSVFWTGIVAINLTAAIAVAVSFDLSQLVLDPTPANPVSIPELRGSIHYLETDQPFSLPGPQSHALSYWA